LSFIVLIFLFVGREGVEPLADGHWFTAS